MGENSETDSDYCCNSDCCIHFESVNERKLSKCTQVGWGKIVEFAKRWKNLKAQQPKLRQPEQVGVASQLLDKLNLNKLSQKSYHRSCYSKFTHSNRLKDAEEKQGQNSSLGCDSTEPNHGNEGTADSSGNDRPGPSKRLKRSRRTSVGSNILPPVCIICRKEKNKQNRLTLKRSKEKLIACQKITGGMLQEVAKAKDDTELMVHIEAQDLVAIEAKYHASCYKKYVRSATEKKEKRSEGPLYEASFAKFFLIAADLLIEKKQVRRLKYLKDVFVKTAKDTEQLDATKYKTGRLKLKLQDRFPQLCFTTARRRTQSCLVFSRELCTEDIIEDAVASCTSSSCETSEELPPKEVQQDSRTLLFEQQKHRDLFMCAQSLKSELPRKDRNPPWPPTGADVRLDRAKALIPVSLFNFVCWLIGASDDAGMKKDFISVDDRLEQKVLSICQDIIFLASSGRVLTPKHVALGMTIRNLTGSSMLIGIVLGLGHCVSHSFTLEHDTALAERQLQRGPDAIPPQVSKDEFLTLVSNNNDFGEETLCGLGTTHIFCTTFGVRGR